VTINDSSCFRDEAAKRAMVTNNMV